MAGSFVRANIVARLRAEREAVLNIACAAINFHALDRKLLTVLLRPNQFG